MELRYTNHARQRMAEREITEDQIAEIISGPTVTRTTADVVVYERAIGERPLRVVVRRDVDPPLVITAMVIDNRND